MNSNPNDWIPVERKLPPAGSEVELMDEYGHITIGLHCGLMWIFPGVGSGNAIAYWRHKQCCSNG